MIVSDNGTELTSNAILAWSKDHKVEWHHIAPERRMQDGYVESFNGRMLNESLFIGLDHARSAIAEWADHMTIFGRTHRLDTRPRPTIPDHRCNRLHRYEMCELRVSAGCSHRAIWLIKN